MIIFVCVFIQLGKLKCAIYQDANKAKSNGTKENSDKFYNAQTMYWEVNTKLFKENC